MPFTFKSKHRVGLLQFVLMLMALIGLTTSASAQRVVPDVIAFDQETREYWRQVFDNPKHTRPKSFFREIGQQAPHDPGRIYVQFRPEANSVDMTIANLRAGVYNIKWQSNVIPGLIKVEVAPGRELEAIHAYLDDERVVYAEPDYAAEPASLYPNDPLVGLLWGMQNARAPQAWQYYTGNPNKLIAVIDSGIVTNHPDLVQNYVGGWNFGTNTPDPSDEAGPQQCPSGWHGTHVAGTIAGRGNNGIGVAGVMWDAAIVAMKVGGSIPQCFFHGMPEALLLALDNNIRVSNNSWGGPQYQQTMYNAILAGQAPDKNHVFVVAAHNHGMDIDVQHIYPASYDLDNIISVASINHNDQLSSFSNHGIVSVDLAAPGGFGQGPQEFNILSTVGPGHNYDFMPGTSMACPHVAGAVAMVQSLYNEQLAWTVVKAKILESSRPLQSLQGKTLTGGTLDIAAAIRVYVNLMGNPAEGIGSYRQPFRTLDAAFASAQLWPQAPVAFFPGTSNFTGDLNQPIIMTSVGGEVLFGVQAGAMPPASCVGFCGGSPAQQCWCDEGCCLFADCCANKHATCGGCNPNGGGGNPNSCAGNCGNQAPGGCWCDAECHAQGDCCPDACAACPNLPHCGGGGNPNSCVGHCGNQAPGECWCDNECCQWGDCCADKVDVCGPC